VKEKKKEVSEQDIRKCVKEWVAKVLEHCHKTGLGQSHNDLPRLVCPVPECHGRVEYENGEWLCVWHNCGFVIPEDLAPPSPAEMNIFCEERRRRRILQKTEERIREICTTF